MVPDRLTTASERVKIGDGKASAFFYRDGIKAIQQQLATKGFLKSKPDGAFGPATQGARPGIPEGGRANPSGMPDDVTLMGLFYAGPAAPGRAPSQLPQRRAPRRTRRRRTRAQPSRRPSSTST